MACQFNSSKFISNKDPQFIPDSNGILSSTNTSIEPVETYLVNFFPKFSAKKFSWPQNIKIKYQYNNLMNGCCIITTPTNISSIAQTYPIIQSYVKDQKVKITQQTVPPFISRIGANHSSQKSGNGVSSLDWRTTINVFIVDTGIANAHPDLNVVGGQNFTNGNTSAWNDDHGHGTHVAGIAGARDNGHGIVGVAPGIRLWAIKVLDAEGTGFTSDIIAGLNWILQTRGTLWTGRGIVNMSFGGPTFALLDDAVNNLALNGIIPVAAAGNQSINAANISPARAPNAITVGATEPNPNYTRLASYSNFGTVVDILAPGSNILSTIPPNKYALMSGTSMATPVVTGTIALLLNIAIISGGNTITFVKNVRNNLINTSSNLTPTNHDGSIGSNPRIIIPTNKPSTNISVWAGSY